MIAQLAVVGAGQLGSRHLEALARLDRPAEIWVFDPSPESLARARARWEEAKPGPGLSADFSGRLPQRLDAAVIATDAASREKALGDLLRGRSVKYLILEKLLFQDPDGLSRAGALIEKSGARAWVNCPRRLWPQYRDLRPKLPLKLSVSGSGWGLASNTVHYLDLAAYYTGCLDFTVDASGLSREEAPSKRPGFVEFHGTVKASGGGHEVSLSCSPGAAKDCRVDLSGTAVDENGAPPQSRLTQGVIAELLSRGECGLTPYEESARLHRPYLTALREHWRKVKDKKAAFCPVT